MQRVRTLGLVFITLGVIELSWCAFCVFGGAILAVVGFADDKLGPLLWIGGGAYGLLAFAALIMGSVHIGSGAMLRKGRGTVAAVVGMATCLPSLILALYCFPFSFGALIYGIVVLLDPEARKALEGEALV